MNNNKVLRAFIYQPMTLDEAIKHAEEVAEENEKFCFKKNGKGGYFNEDTDWDNKKCAAEHRQLAEWLEELKMYKSLTPRELISEKQKNDRVIEYSKGFDYGFKTGYNKAMKDMKELKQLREQGLCDEEDVE